MIRKNKLFILLLFLLHGQVKGQTSLAPWLSSDIGNQNVNTGDILQKDLAHGTANITIPFYQYSNSGVDLSISMSYNTQAIQVDRVSSDIGLGWELNCGGYIQREVRDFPDDIKIDNCGSSNSRLGFWYLSPTVSNSTDDINDGEADIFYLTFGGRQVKFMFSRSGELLTIPKTRIKIERFIGSNPFTSTPTSAIVNGAILDFVVTDEGGNKFYYSRVLRMNEKHERTGCSDVDYFPIQKWALDKIVTYEGQVIQYYYTTISTTHEWHSPQSTLIDNSGPQGSTSLHWYPPHTPSGEKVVEAKYLDSIEFPDNIKVKFSYDTRCDFKNGKRLTELKISENNVAGISTPHNLRYIFDQAYFVCPLDRTVAMTTSNSYEYPIQSISCNDYYYNSRLKLNGINYSVNGTTPRKYYSFGYSALGLPQRVKGARDIYGHANEFSVPYITCPEDNYDYFLMTTYVRQNNTIGMNKTPSGLTYLESCMLKKITNGQSGQIDIQYTTNTDKSTLMIDQIKTFDGYNHDNDVISKYTYDYGSNFTGASFINYGVTMNGVNFWNSLSCSYTLNEGLNGGHIVFTAVTEDTRDRANNLVKRTEYNFSGWGSYTEINNGADDNDLSYVASRSTIPHTNKQYLREWGIGLPLSTIYKDNNNNILKKEKYKYTITETSKYGLNDWGHLAKIATDFDANSKPKAGISNYATDVYYPYTGQVYLTEQVTESYYNISGYIENKVALTYDDSSNLLTKTTYNSLNQPIVEKYFYNYNWPNNTSNSTINNMNNDKIDKLLFTEIWKNGTLRNSSVTGLYMFSGTRIIRPTYTYQLAVATPPSSGGGTGTDIITAYSGGAVTNMRKTGSVSQYDSKGYPTEVTDATGTKYNSTIWDNKTGAQLASVSNAKYNEIAYTGFESEYGQGIDKGHWEYNTSAISTNTSNVFLGRKGYNISTSGMYSTTSLEANKEYYVSVWVKDGGKIGINTCNSDPVNIKEIETVNGWTLYKAKIKIGSGCGYIGMWRDGSSSATDVYIDEPRIYPVNSEMTNVNITPLLGKTSDVDANERVTYYEYDTSGHLHITRDHKRNILTKTEQVTQGQ